MEESWEGKHGPEVGLRDRPDFPMPYPVPCELGQEQPGVETMQTINEASFIQIVSALTTF